jgi:proteasome lid subunit RPN8/RPN11
MANFTRRVKTGPPSPLVRPRPADGSNFVAFCADDDSFSAYIHLDVLEFIRRESLRIAPDEAIGLLAGRTCQDPARGPYTLVMVADGARDGEVEASPSHVHISAYGNACVRQRLENSHPDREIVGWYHSHPRYPAQFSHVDIAEQSTWNDSHHIGIVFSGTETSEPFGVYRGPGAIRLSRRREGARANATTQPVFATRKAETERAGTERTQPDGAKLITSFVAPPRHRPAPRMARFGGLLGVAQRLLAVLVLLGLLAGVIWLHLRVRSIEKALPGAKGLVSSMPPAQAAAPDKPQPPQPSSSTDMGAQNNPAQKTGIGAGNQTVITDDPPLINDANPLQRKAARPKNQRVAKNRKPEARDKKRNTRR